MPHTERPEDVVLTFCLLIATLFALKKGHFQLSVFFGALSTYFADGRKPNHFLAIGAALFLVETIRLIAQRQRDLPETPQHPEQRHS